MARLRLTHPPEEYIEHAGKRYRLTMTFDRVLLFFEFLDQEMPTQEQAIELGLALFADRPEAIPHTHQAEILERIFLEHIKDRDNPPADPGQPKAMDLTKDAPYIYAGFLQAYGIDLHQQIGKMQWRQFAALLDGLPADTRLREIINIRLRPIPNPTKYNREEIAELRRLKQIYSLEPEALSYEDGLAKLWSIAKARAIPRR